MLIEGGGKTYAILKCDECKDKFNMESSEYDEFRIKNICRPLGTEMLLLCPHCKGETKVGKREKRLSQLLDKPKPFWKLRNIFKK